MAMTLLLMNVASHRSRVLGTEPPKLRIAKWSQAILPALQESAGSRPTYSADTNIAMTIMMASLEITSPGALGHGVSWRKHASHAQAMALQNCLRTKSERRSFLHSWLAYINDLGCLMSGPAVALNFCLLPAKTKTWDEPEGSNCVSPRCIHLLGDVAHLIKMCNGQGYKLDGHVLQGFNAHRDTLRQAKVLELQLQHGLAQSWQPCSHVIAADCPSDDVKEMAALDEAFHRAALIHLYRRAVQLPSTDDRVQHQVCKIIHCCMAKIRNGSPGELQLLFPAFAAGCETMDESMRATILKRLQSAEKLGMRQVSWKWASAMTADNKS